MAAEFGGVANLAAGFPSAPRTARLQGTAGDKRPFF
jgi:hypothetical protein